MDRDELEGYEREISTLLTVWGVGSVVKGGVIALLGKRTGRRQWMTFGRQTAMWGVVDALIAGAGTLSRSRRGELTQEQVDAEARKLRTLLLINAAADVVYIAGGAHIAVRAGREGTSFRMTRGDGLAILIQGAFLLALDATYARKLSPP
ncbi:MAG: hypothetical protein RLZ94_938 [Actinomycetota bacterium]|jgi:hypothetical protein